MPRTRLTLIFSALLLGALLSPTFATPTLTISDGAGNTANGTNKNGNLAFSGPVGEWFVTIFTTRPAGGGISNQVATALNVTSFFEPSGSPPPNGNQLTVAFTADGLPSVSGPATALATASVQQSFGSTVFTTLTNNVLLTSAGTTNLSGGTPNVNLSNTVPVAGFTGPLTMKAVLVATASELVVVTGNFSVSNGLTNVPLQFLPDGILSPSGFKMTLEGMTVGSNYLVQGSTDLVSWQSVTNFKSASVSTNLTDTNAVKLVHRFYRAKAQ